MHLITHSKTVIYVASVIAFLASINVYIGVKQVSTTRGTPGSTPSLRQDNNRNTEQTRAVTYAATSTAASRLERMEMYQKRYKYQPPSPYFNHTERDELCGTSPNFETYFSKNEFQRSANNEDKTIYNLFFKDDNDKGIKRSVVEMGAYNGIQESNSRFFNVCLGWETMLVEGNPLLWDKVTSSRPHAHRFSYAPSCSEEDEIANKTVKFDNYPMTNGGLADGSVTTAYTWKNHTVDVPCGSLTKVLLDIFPHGHVSFFSLDVEGAEPLVVDNIDFDKVFIEVMMIENKNNFCKQRCESRDKFRKIMQDAGYERFGPVRKSDLFIHPLSKHLQTMKKMLKRKE
mmetsp:Transcript_27245/g.40342  ORF Transcript_27245/g.40342 Transcript_27245/m.40342 type:complete len:343 (-) Transcript_27245:82-1110(-)